MQALSTTQVNNLSTANLDVALRHGGVGYPEGDGAGGRAYRRPR